MIIKKSGNMIFGAILNAKEKKALDIEMKKAAAKTLDNMEKDIDVMILWQLHIQEGWGKKRLERFYRDFSNAYDQLKRYYEVGDNEPGTYICDKQLKEIGVDVEELAKEKHNGTLRTL